MTASGWHRKRATPAEAQRRKDYGSREHRQARIAGQSLVDRGHAHCWRCGAWLPPGSKWHVGHDDNDRTIIRGVECVRCNLRAAASKGARVRNRLQQVRATRRW